MSRSLLLFILLTPWQSLSAPLVMAVGDKIQIKTLPHDTIWLSNGRIAKIKDLHSHIQVFAQKIGTTYLKIAGKSRTLKVISKKNYKTYRQLSEITKKMEGLTVHIDDRHQVSITGKLLRWQDWSSITKKLQCSSGFSFQSQIPNHLKQEISKKFSRILKQQNLPEIDVQFFPKPRALIPQSLKALKKHYQKLFTCYGLKVTLSPHLLSPPPMVATEITIAEVKRSEMEKFGLHWKSHLQAQLSPGGFLSSPLQVSLQALQTRGQHQILARPTLICQSGQSADFLAGGEIPIHITKNDKQSVVWKKYGLLVKVSPKVDLKGQIQLSIETEISSIDMGHAAQGVPAFNTNRVKSQFSLRRSQTIVLSGLIQQNWGRAVEGLPALQEIPILGRLFSSQDFLKDKTELVIFVTPRIIDPHSSSKKKPPPSQKLKDKSTLLEDYLSQGV